MNPLQKGFSVRWLHASSSIWISSPGATSTPFNALRLLCRHVFTLFEFAGHPDVLQWFYLRCHHWSILQKLCPQKQRSSTKMAWVKKQTLMFPLFYATHFSPLPINLNFSFHRHDFVGPEQMFSAGSSCSLGRGAAARCLLPSPCRDYAHHWCGGAIYANTVISWVSSDQIDFVQADLVDLSEIGWELFAYTSLPRDWICHCIAVPLFTSTLSA